MLSVTRLGFYALVLITTTHGSTDVTKQSETVVDLYEEGTQAYLEERFPKCVEKLESAIKKYRYHLVNTQNCRLKCRDESESSEPLFSVDIENLRFYEKSLRNTLCVVKCKVDSNGNNDNIQGNIMKIFEERKPYEYLHLCYNETGDFQKAASAAFTFLVAHPDHHVMKKSLEQYSKLPQVDMKNIVNFEAKDFVYLYAYGSDAYDKKEWNTAANYMEESLVNYLHAEDECRALCEGPYNHGWYPDFIPAISNHFTHALKCKRRCPGQLGSINGEIVDDLLASHYNYLQYAYYKKGNLNAACKAVASYLILLPDDGTMLANMRYYQSLPKVQDNFFTPREEAIRYAQRDTYERKILQFIKDEFKFDNKAQEKKERHKLIPTQASFQLGGPFRLLTDGVASKSECRKLLDLATFAKKNDGYENSKNQSSPHTPDEHFQGMGISRMTTLVYIEILNPTYLKLLMDISEEIKSEVVEKFNITKPLYFSYTHLVCRSASSVSGLRSRINHMSHMIHADNCYMEDGVCEKKDPAFYWRDYSALLYLNDDFAGGEFIFSGDSKGENIESTIRPKCGRMVAFSAGSENLHGVKGVTKGKRCALAIWFTHDPQHRETDRDIADYLLENNVNFSQYSAG